jgi:hypothetical protein
VRLKSHAQGAPGLDALADSQRIKALNTEIRDDTSSLERGTWESKKGKVVGPASGGPNKRQDSTRLASKLHPLTASLAPLLYPQVGTS